METFDAPRLGEDEEQLVVWAIAAGLLCGGRRREAYTEAQLARKMALERRQAERFGADSPPGSGRRYLLRRELEELIELAGLSDDQRRLVAMAARGYGPSEIARGLGVPRTSVASRLERAYGLIRRARRRYPYADLYEIYDSETRL